ncbi:hypothetical protein [Pelistega sp. MC2]|uniref:hypothetical protein n=1 Tax=Pelistega sp. MC2 TaxID=1720297 RepID=UPI0008D9FCB9|nr:hypothetical protein [Pelistega sp. MC2]
MGVVFILMILVLGYYYVSNYLPAKVELKRSNGWEAYVNLGKHGLIFLLQGFVISAFFFIALWLIEKLFYILGSLFSWNSIDLTTWFFKPIVADFCAGYMCILAISFILCKGKVNEKNKDRGKILHELRGADSILNLVIEAASVLSLVKISLKSKKVYIGLIDSEQFEYADLDNIVIIPYLSGYREKDSLSIKFDCNYAVVYDKKKLTSEDIRSFRMVIRTPEIESISLFNDDYYEDFEYYDYAQDTAGKPS